MALSGGVDLVNGIGSGVQCRVEAEGDLGGQQVLVDGLGHSNDGQSGLEELIGDGQRTVSPNHDQPVQLHCPDLVDDFLGVVLRFYFALFVSDRIAKGIPLTGRSQNSASSGKDAPHRVQCQGHHLIGLKETFEAVLASPDFPAMPENSRFDYRPDNGVQSWAIAATVENTDFLL